MVERRQENIDLLSKFHESEVKAVARFTKLESKMDTVDSDLKDIKMYLEKLTDKLNVTEDEFWEELQLKTNSMEEKLSLLKKDKTKLLVFLAAASSIPGSMLANIWEKLLKFI